MLITGAPEDTRNNQDSLSDDEITVHIYVHIFYSGTVFSQGFKLTPGT